MTAMPPEPDYSEPPTVPRPVWPSAQTYQPSALPPPPEPSAADLAGPRRPRIGPGRVIRGSIWAAITLICAVGGVAEFTVGVTGGGVVCLIVAAGAGWYDYRLWRRPRLIEY